MSDALKVVRGETNGWDIFHPGTGLKAIIGFRTKTNAAAWQKRLEAVQDFSLPNEKLVACMRTNKPLYAILREFRELSKGAKLV